MRAGLFFYECLRLLLLVVFIYAASLGNSFGVKGFPYLVYLSANALFPMMVLFVWLRPEEHWNYLSLYMAGKIIGLITFYIWQYFSSREFLGTESQVIGTFLFFGSAILCLTDILSLWGAWALKKEFHRALARTGAQAASPAL